MCRIFYQPSDDLTFNQADIFGFFNKLETLGGGDGNGIYLFNDGTLVKSHTCMPTWIDIDGSFLFHTRIATHGKISEYNCQPFVGDNYILVHNGSFTAIEPYARLLGFIWSDKKYSDSYMAHYIIEKVGILNFYNALKDKYYGVILVYDKKTKIMYLLKTGGQFTWGKFTKSGAYIYASTALSYWAIDGTPESFDSGLYILNADGFQQLHKIVRTTYSSTPSRYGEGWKKTYGSKYNNYKGSSKKKKKKKKYKNVQTKDQCDYCQKFFWERETRYKDFGNEICRKCWDAWGSDKEGGKIEKDPDGILALFEDKTVPRECTGCKWWHEHACYFGGRVHKLPIHKRLKSGKCNTNTSKWNVIYQCDKCQKRLTNEDNWKMIKTQVICGECLDEIDKEQRDYAKDTSLVGTCETCAYYHQSSMDEPCKTCIDTDNTNCMWESEENCNKCWFCGFHFYDDDQVYEDDEGRKMCDICHDYGYGEYDEDIAPNSLDPINKPTVKEKKPTKKYKSTKTKVDKYMLDKYEQELDGEDYSDHRRFG